MARFNFRWLVAASRVLTTGALTGALVVAVGACGSSKKDAASGGGGDVKGEFVGVTRPTAITHDPCDPKAPHGVKTYEADDKVTTIKPYVTHVFDGSREICSFADLNGDGRVDVYTYLDDTGKTRRRESAYSASASIDEIATYKAGDLDVIARETNYDGKLDTWDFYEGGKLVRRERDKTGDGHIDEWWTFDSAAETVTVTQAEPRSGRPDPEQSLVLSTAGGTIKPLGDAATAPKPAPTPSAIPKPAAAATPPPAAPTPSAAPKTPDTGKPKGTH
ncbi:MAG: hypothetical protein ACHREM_22880 [Polyangiales bacterium]